MKHEPPAIKPATGPLSSRSLFELSLFSTVVFVFAALFVQFLLTLYTATLLKIVAYPFQYRLFSIHYLSESQVGWTDSQILMVFGMGPIIISIIGFWLLNLLKRTSGLSWKIMLVFSWTAFLMVYTLPCGIVVGTFSFDSFGILFKWFNDNFLLRGLIAMAVFASLLFFNQFWLMLFLRTAYSSHFTQESGDRRIFIRNVVFKPWIYGFFILLFFNWPFNSLYWPVFILIIGFLLIPIEDKLLRFPNFHIRDIDSRIFKSRFQIFFFAVLLVLLWFANYAIIYFRYNIF